MPDLSASVDIQLDGQPGALAKPKLIPALATP